MEKVGLVIHDRRTHGGVRVHVWQPRTVRRVQFQHCYHGRRICHVHESGLQPHLQGRAGPFGGVAVLWRRRQSNDGSHAVRHAGEPAVGAVVLRVQGAVRGGIQLRNAKNSAIHGMAIHALRRKIAL